MKISLRKKLLLMSLSLLFFVTITAALISSFELRRYYKVQIFEQLKVQLDQLEFLLANDTFGDTFENIKYDHLAAFSNSSAFRLTLIDSSGLVVFDSQIPQDSLKFVENHINRPEIQNALVRSFGTNQRKSATINKSLFYTARLVSPHYSNQDFFNHFKFIRISIPLTKIEKVLGEVQWKIFAGGGIALLIIAIFSYWMSAKFTDPINRLTIAAVRVKKGEMDAHFEKTTNDEIGELADLLNEMVKKLRQDFIQMKKLETVRTQFLGNVSHELRTPIFTVQGYLETLLEAKDFDQKTLKTFIAKAYSQAQRLNNLLTDLIDISRIESGEMKMNFAPFNVHNLLKNVVAELLPTAEKSDVHLSIAQSDNKNIIAMGDQDRIHQLVINLAQNAIKYNVPQGKVKLGFIEEKHKIKIYVTDTGKGIAEEHIPRLFERFYRVDKERSRAVGGTGLGLAIVKHIAEAHDGKINVKSEVGKGSTFSFVLKKA